MRWAVWTIFSGVTCFATCTATLLTERAKAVFSVIGSFEKTPLAFCGVHSFISPSSSVIQETALSTFVSQLHMPWRKASV